MRTLKAFSASAELIQRIHDFRRSRPDPQPSESEAIRRLLEVGLAVVEPRYKPSQAGPAFIASSTGMEQPAMLRAKGAKSPRKAASVEHSLSASQTPSPEAPQK
jgi:hypothetical protein